MYFCLFMLTVAASSLMACEIARWLDSMEALKRLENELKDSMEGRTWNRW